MTKKDNCRIETTFNNLRDKNKPALITFITAGDPNISATKSILEKLPKAGADLIEIGIPFSDPMADGPIIQRSYKRALKNKTDLDKVLSLVKIFRKKDTITPIILMGYYNPFYQKGLKLFFEEAENAGVDGILIVDLPPENDNEIAENLKNTFIKFIRLATPTTDHNRLKKILKLTSGFLYFVSIKGITGSNLANLKKVKNIYKKLKERSKIPVVVGFGINTPDKAKSVCNYADGVVIGSSIVSEIDKKIDKKFHINNILKVVRNFSESIKTSRK